MSNFTKTKGGFHADTATGRAKYARSTERAKASWLEHRASGKPPHTWENPAAEPIHDRYTRAKSEGILRSGAPMRSIKESLVNRGTGIRAAANYTPTPRVGALKAIAKAVGTVGGQVAKGAARLSGPVGVGLLALDAYDTVKDTVRVAKGIGELGRVRAAGREAELGAAEIRTAMKNKYPLSGTNFSPSSEVKADKSVVKVGKGQRKDRQSTITGIKVN